MTKEAMDTGSTGKKTVIIKTGDTFPDIARSLGDFEDWVRKGMGLSDDHTQVVDVARGQALPEKTDCRRVVITGSHAMVTDLLPWSLAVEAWLPGLIRDGVPVLGICYGHQLLARAMGGVVDYHPGGLEIGTVWVDRATVEPDLLFQGLPERFTAHVCHSQTVVRLPDGAVKLAWNAFEPHHAFRIGSCAWGVQFHPEYDETIMRAYAGNMEAAVNGFGHSLPEVLDQVAPAVHAARILERFAAL